LLDVLYANHGYSQLLSLPITNSIFSVSAEFKVSVPTIDGILGDKLMAFAPNTIGVPWCSIPYRRRKNRGVKGSAPGNNNSAREKVTAG
jgi:hypothetical protein